MAAATVGLAAFGQAEAQIKLPADFDGFSIVNLRDYALTEDGKVPPVADMQEGREMSLSLSDEGYLLGTVFTQGCVHVWRTGEGRMAYSMKGGRHHISAKCENLGITDYEWTTNVTFSPGRIHLDGDATTMKPCLPRNPNCQRDREIVSERAVLRVQGNQCFLESYRVKTTWVSYNPYLPTPTETTFIAEATPRTRCKFL